MPIIASARETKVLHPMEMGGDKRGQVPKYDGFQEKKYAHDVPFGRLLGKPGVQMY